MAQTYMSSLVFVGGEFPLAMFDERALFDSHLDTDQLKAGPIGRFSYSSGLYRFNVTPGRIDLICQNTDILPQAVVDSAKIIAEVIEPARGAVRVSGVGMNCDTVFNQQYCGMKGVSFCSRMFDPRIADLVGAPPIDTRAGVRFRKDEVLYDVRIEPEANSSGENLYIAVNGHQEVKPNDRLEMKMNHIGDFRAYVLALHQRIADSARSE